MRINEPDVQVVIHAGIPLSMSNLTQESGRAGRDGLPAKAIIMFNRKDIRTVMRVYSGEHDSLSHNEENNENNEPITDYFAWPEDPESKECNICDNCIRRMADNPIYGKNVKSNRRNY
ncbi:9171_t:CDS:2 [Diversispora eburnea]|uniref:DNA 3'-5' helicase n=1 Tax=Diversispora eburnea TaxID=1213867 RepID=A0A9N8V641_9GLOM|nr:9171_t:CDS:2 [Diversispora eburnea]